MLMHLYFSKVGPSGYDVRRDHAIYDRCIYAHPTDNTRFPPAFARGINGGSHPGSWQRHRPFFARYAAAQIEDELAWRTDRPTRLDVTGLEQDDQGVNLSVTNRADSSSRTLRARWVIGADSANSSIRQFSNIAFEDQGERLNGEQLSDYADDVSCSKASHMTG